MLCGYESSHTCPRLLHCRSPKGPKWHAAMHKSTAHSGLVIAHAEFPSNGIMGSSHAAKLRAVTYRCGWTTISCVVVVLLLSLVLLDQRDDSCNRPVAYVMPAHSLAAKANLLDNLCDARG